MGDGPPRLTVGLPVYNGERYIDETLRALRSQSFDDFVLFVADNASTDGTRDVVEAHMAEDDRIVLDVAERNQGAAFNWNRCYLQSTTEYFTWACADDVPLADKFARCIELLDAEGPDTVLAYPATELIDDDGVITGPYDDMGTIGGVRPSHRFLRIVRDLHLVHPLFGVMRTDTLASTRGCGAYSRADTVLLGELAMRGRFGFVDEVLFQRRIHEASAMAGSDASVATHYTGSAEAGPRYPFSRLLRGHLGAVASAPIPVVDRLRCAWALTHWRYRRQIPRELRSGARRTAGRLRARGRRRAA